MQSAKALSEAEPGALPDCALCGSTELAAAYELADRDGNAVAIRQCLSCSVLVPAFPRPDGPEATSQQVRLHEEHWRAEGEDEIRKLVTDCVSIVDAFADYLGAPAANRWVAEIGAGRGGLLGALKVRGYRVVGCEPAPLLYGRARAFAGLSEEEVLQLSADDFLDRAQAESWPVRAWFAWHVLEHLPRAWDTVRRIAELSDAGDHLIGQFPLLCKDSLFAEHYFFVTEPALVGLAESSGFELVRLDYDHERAFVGFVFKRRPGPVPARAWAAARAPQVGAEVERRLSAEEIRRLRHRIDADRRMLTEREEALEAQASRIEDLQRTSEVLQDKVDALEAEVGRAARERDLLRDVLLNAEQRRRSRETETLWVTLGLHASHRLFHKWKHVRGLNAPTVAPTIRERLVAYVAARLPPTAARMSAEDLDKAVGVAAGMMKKAVGRLGRTAGEAIRKVRRR